MKLKNLKAQTHESKIVRFFFGFFVFLFFFRWSQAEGEISDFTVRGRGNKDVEFQSNLALHRSLAF